MTLLIEATGESEKEEWTPIRNTSLMKAGNQRADAGRGTRQPDLVLLARPNLSGGGQRRNNFTSFL